jgi:fructosamine-3-kinase
MGARSSPRRWPDPEGCSPPRYDEVFPLSTDADQRVRLWQLAPLLVHTTLFGGGYASAVATVAAEYR